MKQELCNGRQAVVEVPQGSVPIYRYVPTSWLPERRREIIIR